MENEMVRILIIISTMITGVYLIVISHIVYTRNKIIFKVIPWFLGMCCIFSSFKLIGII